MDSEWQLQEAKGNFSQLIRRAASGQAQTVTVHGKPAAVVVSADEYARLTRRSGKLSSALLWPGLVVEDHDFPRSPDIGRNVEL
ncbi:MAG: type II toxin-antitoxin system Phd/YefM family antitoxin [Betaproteobacteria bacterium]|nr:type II toxin-antitoxin system Phd/YefM family antitoxin [Betaproteobacteria bacterium]